jgi:hypothetical protein
MNWRRGMFRVWLVLSCLWIVGTSRYYHLVAPESFFQGGRAAMCGPVNGEESLGWFCASGWRADNSGAFKLTPIHEAIGWTIGPPLAALLIGLALFWVCAASTGFQIRTLPARATVEGGPVIGLLWSRRSALAIVKALFSMAVLPVFRLLPGTESGPA